MYMDIICNPCIKSMAWKKVYEFRLESIFSEFLPIFYDEIGLWIFHVLSKYNPHGIRLQICMSHRSNQDNKFSKFMKILLIEESKLVIIWLLYCISHHLTDC